jgi:hypothetical protein
MNWSKREGVVEPIRMHQTSIRLGRPRTTEGVTHHSRWVCWPRYEPHASEALQRFLVRRADFGILKYMAYKIKLWLYLLFCMGVKIGLSPTGSNELRMFENEVHRRIFWPKREEVNGGWRRLGLLNEELHNLYPSSDRLLLGWPNQGGWDGRGM